MPINNCIDYTLLKSASTQGQVESFCQAAIEYAFHAVCLPPAYLPLAATVLEGHPVRLCSVVGFPLGMHFPEVKLLEAERCIDYGAEELDAVINLGAWKSGHRRVVQDEINRLRMLTDRFRCQLKIIIETGLLDQDEIRSLCELCAGEHVDFIKTSTGFVNPGAELDKVRLMRNILPEQVGIKASGGIRTVAQAEAFIDAGATRIGTSSLLTEAGDAAS